jgi:hypothetical protein
MHHRHSKSLPSRLVLTVLGAALLTSCTHRLGPKMESARVARGFGLAAGCTISEPMRRYQTLDYADLVGYSHLADSPEWITALSMMQPGDQLRRVYCKTGDNYFGLFRGNSVIYKFGMVLYD